MVIVEKTFNSEALGSGSFGQVFKVIEKNSDKQFAVKRIELTDIKKQLNEIRIMTNLISHFAVKYHGSWTECHNTSVVAYIQMELCMCNLQDLIESINRIKDDNYKPIVFDIRTQMLCNLIECLNDLHSQNPPIVHRDLKPQNVLISEGNDGLLVKLCDFGLCKGFEGLTNTGDVGTLRYIAPEVRKLDEHGNSQYDKTCDIYSLGMIATDLFQLKKVKAVRLGRGL